jgi:type VI protein secretion system component VasF
MGRNALGYAIAAVLVPGAGLFIMPIALFKAWRALKEEDERGERRCAWWAVGIGAVFYCIVAWAVLAYSAYVSRNQR